MTDERGQTGREIAEELGRKAGRLMKAAKPRLARLMSEARPRAEQARRDAAQYAREHEGEIKQSAAKIIRTRVRGPLGVAVDALASQMADKPAGSTLCPRCQVANATDARFCNQCGAALPAAQP